MVESLSGRKSLFPREMKRNLPDLFEFLLLAPDNPPTSPTDGRANPLIVRVEPPYFSVAPILVLPLTFFFLSEFEDVRMSDPPVFSVPWPDKFKEDEYYTFVMFFFREDYDPLAKTEALAF